jgi:hypothetical protein
MLLFATIMTLSTTAYTPNIISSSLSRYRTPPRVLFLSRNTDDDDNNNDNDNDNENEIAKLEEQIRQLRAAAAAATTNTNINNTSSFRVTEMSDKENLDGTSSSSLTTSGNEPTLLDAMFSERWKEDDNNTNITTGNPILAVMTTIIVMIGILIVSQIPMGDEGYRKYSAVKTTTTIDLGDLNAVRIKTVQGL